MGRRGKMEKDSDSSENGKLEKIGKWGIENWGD